MCVCVCVRMQRSLTRVRSVCCVGCPAAGEFAGGVRSIRHSAAVDARLLLIEARTIGLSPEIEDLKARNAALEQRNAALEKRNTAAEAKEVLQAIGVLQARVEVLGQRVARCVVGRMRYVVAEQQIRLNVYC